ncbi:helix-turn-helix domain-containing protein [Pseudonocardia sp. NPDC049635]|uniref:helix-turn-helix domain-containing protein n=1 Tax=Pseudonocardia sp. NPDC049635 TaxID=3155506 RepID=UPI0033EF94E5
MSQIRSPEAGTGLLEAAEKNALAYTLNLARRNLTVEVRRGLVAGLRADGKTQQEIADTLGVSRQTVQLDLSNDDVANIGNVPTTITDTKGRQQPTRKPRKAAEKASPAKPRVNVDQTQPKGR